MKTPTHRLLELGLLATILIGYGLLAAAYAIRTPAWQVPDETAHYNYVRQLAETGRYPVIEMGDWNQPYQDMMTRCNFHPAVVEDDPALASINPPYLEACGYDPALAVGFEVIEYEDHQPPLYYTLQAGMYQLSDGDLKTMRLFSALLGAGAIVCAWAIVRRIFPDQPWLAIVAAGIIAFIPQRLAIMGGVSNDSLAETLGGVLLLLITLYLTREQIQWPLAMGMGIVAGLIFLTKTTVYFTAGIAGLAILLRWWREKWPLGAALPHVLGFGVVAIVLGSIWWLHSIDVYGGTDFLGLQRHDEVVEGQLRTEDYIQDFLGGNNRRYVDELTRTTFQSFWGQFGWMGYPIPQPRIYTALRVLMGVLLVGAVIGAIIKKWPRTLQRPQAELVALFSLSIVLVVAQFLFYNRTFVQFQGRYLYPALIPFALVLALGVDGWRHIIPIKHPLWAWVSVVVVLVMALLAIYALRDVISAIPQWE